MFNEQEHMQRMSPIIDKLIAALKKKNIAFEPTDETGRNAVFKLGDETRKVSHHSVYRFSGIACVYRTNDDRGTIEIVEVTDEMYVMNFLLPCIELQFGLNVKK